MEYIKNIKNFIDSEKFFHFTADRSIEDFIREIKKLNT